MDRKTIEEVARLARLELTDEAKARFATQLSAILEYFDSLQALDTSAVEPSAYSIDVAGETRPDEVRPCPDRDTLMNNTPHRRDGYFEVPRVIE